jgi:Zn-dependent protease with chaperone function
MSLYRKALLLFAVLIAAVLLTNEASARAQARSAVVQSDGTQAPAAVRLAFLDITANRRGAASPELTVDFPVSVDTQMRSALSQVFVCPEQTWQSYGDSSDDAYALRGDCELRSNSRKALESIAVVDVTPLERVLNAHGIQTLEITLYADKSGYIECSPTPSEILSLRGTNECAYSDPITADRSDEIRFSYGYHTPSLAAAALVLALVLLFPIPLTLWMRRKAALVPEEAKQAVWFAYLRYRNWGMIGGFLLWWTAIDLLGVDQILSYSLGPAPESLKAFSFILPWIGLWIPPVLVYALAFSLSAPIQKVSGSQRTEREIVRHSFWISANLVVPIVFVLAGIGLISYSPRASVLCFFAWLLAILFGRARAARASGLELHALTTGELRDRAFAIANRAGVKLNQVYVIPTIRMRIANAFAHSRQNVLLTDYLLHNLSKREVDAILGHEIIHLQKRHGRSKGMLILIGLATFGYVLAWLDSLMPQRFPTGPIFLLVFFLLAYFISRRNEFAADRGSVQLTGDAEAMITALIKISRLNTLPIHWNRLNEPAMSHPSTMRRLFAIADAGRLSKDRVSQLLAQSGGAPAETYALPPTVTPMGKIFSTRFKHKVQNIYGWTSLVCATVVPGVIAFVISLMHLAGETLWTAYAVGFIAALTISVVCSNFAPLYGHAELESNIRAKLAGDAFAREAHDGLFVGLAPDATPRLYESNSWWDVGMLLLTPERLIYCGEEARFSLSRRQITAIALGPGLANWFGTPVVYVSWRTDAGAHRTFNIRPAGANSLTKIRKLTKVFSRDLNDWLYGRPQQPDSIVKVIWGSSELGASLPCPAFGEVSSLSLRSALNRRALQRSFFWVGVVALGVAVLLGLPFIPGADADSSGWSLARLSGWYVLASAWSVSVFQLLPILWRRDSRASSPSQSESSLRG